jgi:inosine-uridine nucleoside N-ribohydrolase
MVKNIILDTDAKNEIDDQYAITYAVLSKELDIQSFTAAHFSKKGSMEKSYKEIHLILKLLDQDRKYPVLKGADQVFKDKETPVDSPAARFIIDKAMKSADKNLYIVSIGAITNLASAYLMEPGIKNKVKALWLAGKAWPKGGLFFNNKNDIIAAQVIFNSGIDLTLVPACGTAEKLKIYRKDKRHVKGRGEIGDYLWKIFMRRLWKPKSIYDIVAIAALKMPVCCTWITAPRPCLLKNGRYDHTCKNGLITVAVDINKEMIRKDFFNLLNKII